MRRVLMLLCVVLAVSGMAMADNVYDDLVAGYTADGTFAAPLDTFLPVDATIGNWSLGWVDETGSNFQPYTQFYNRSSLPNNTHIGGPVNTDAHGTINVNTGAELNMPAWPNGMNWGANSVTMMTDDNAPATPGVHSPDIKWTAPTAGSYDITSVFTNTSSTGPAIGMAVLVNGVVVSDETVSGYLNTISYDASALSLSAGDTVEFVAHSTATYALLGADINIVPVPEPATMLLLSIGGVAGLIRRRK